MSNNFKLRMRNSGMRVVLVLGLVTLFLLTACTGSSRPSGSGVETQILNQREVSEVYFSYIGEVDPSIDPGDLSRQSLNKVGLSESEDYDFLFRLNTLVHNRGYADSLVAMYITGYDPNLFFVTPLGPYSANHESKFCFYDSGHVSGNSFNIFMFCEAFDNVFLGGGVDADRSGINRLRLDFLNLPIDKVADTIISEIRDEEVTFFQETGIFSNFLGSCEYVKDDGDGDTGLSGLTNDIRCDYMFNLDLSIFGRASRGALAMAMYGGKVRNCGNGCVPVPSKVMPQKFIAGDTQLFPGGEGLYVEYAVFLNRSRWPANLNDHQQLFQVNTCYLYTTYVTPNVCIDPTPHVNDGDACRPGIIDFETQPAPLKVSRIEQIPQGPRVMFNIYVENALDGRVFHPGAIDYCSPATPSTFARDKVDVARVIDARVIGSLDTLECANEGRIHLVNGRGKATCTYEIPLSAIHRGGAYQTTMNLEIAYLYRDSQVITSNIHRI